MQCAACYQGLCGSYIGHLLHAQVFDTEKERCRRGTVLEEGNTSCRRTKVRFLPMSEGDVLALTFASTHQFYSHKHELLRAEYLRSRDARNVCWWKRVTLAATVLARSGFCSLSKALLPRPRFTALTGSESLNTFSPSSGPAFACKRSFA